MLKRSCITRESGNRFSPPLSHTSSQDLKITVRGDAIEAILHAKYQTCFHVCRCDVTFMFNPQYRSDKTEIFSHKHA